MATRKISPVLVGRGMAGKAILQSLNIVSTIDSELNLLPARIVDRGTPLVSYIAHQALNVLFLANPSGLHAQSILEGAKAGYNAIAADKPICVRLGEIALLRDLDLPVTVFHGYRAMWGTRMIKQMIDAGELGDLFAFESRYWQSSSAQAVLNENSPQRGWKNDLRLNGSHDALTDLGSHVVDLCHYFIPDNPIESRCWLSYRNAAAEHRDTHVHLQLKFSGSRRAFASISKTAHGATNNLEYTLFGTKGTATWRFLHPDEVELGSGSRSTFIRREKTNAPSATLPFHGLGWLEGYVEITHQTLRKVSGLSFVDAPTLKESLDVMEILLNAQIET